MEQIFCKCGEYIGVRYLETNEIELDSEVVYNTLNKNRMIAECPYCNCKIKIDGKLIPI